MGIDVSLFIDASIDRLRRNGKLPVAAGNNAANRGSSAITSVACLVCINLGMYVIVEPATAVIGGLAGLYFYR